MRIETDTDYYYKTLEVYERLRTEIIEKYGTLCKASKKIGKSSPYLYLTSHVGSVKNLYNICTKLDIDFTYILTGNYQKFTKNIDFSGLLSLYDKKKYTKRQTDSVRSIICSLKSGRKHNIKIAMLFYFSDFYKVNCLELL